MHVFVCACRHARTCVYMSVEVGGLCCLYSFIGLHLMFLRQSLAGNLVLTVYTGCQWAPGVLDALGYRHVLLNLFFVFFLNMVPGHQTQVLTLVWWVLHQLSYLLCPFSWAIKRELRTPHPTSPEHLGVHLMRALKRSTVQPLIPRDEHWCLISHSPPTSLRF